jgi:hypothetical protein
MKTSKQKKTKSKFDLEKMKVVKLKNLHLIDGGNAFADDIKTVTDLSSNCGVSAGKKL